MPDLAQLLLALALFLALPGDAPRVLLGAPAPDIALEDQHGNVFRLRQQQGRVVVLLAGDRSSSGQNHAWGRAIGERYGQGLLVIGIADARGVPFFLRRRVRRSFEKDRVRVLSDWEGRVFRDYGLVPGAANVVLVDRSGFVRFALSGPPSQPAQDRLFRQIDRLISGPRSNFPERRS